MDHLATIQVNFGLRCLSTFLSIFFSNDKIPSFAEQALWKEIDKSGPHTFFCGLYFTRKTSSRVKVSSLTHPRIWLCFSYRTFFISPPSLTLRALGAVATQVWQLPETFVWGGWGKRREGECSQLFPAAVANQSKLPTQTAHSISGATPKPYLWVQSYCDTSHHGV